MTNIHENIFIIFFFFLANFLHWIFFVIKCLINLYENYKCPFYVLPSRNNCPLDVLSPSVSSYCFIFQWEWVVKLQPSVLWGQLSNHIPKSGLDRKWVKWQLFTSLYRIWVLPVICCWLLSDRYQAVCNSKNWREWKRIHD